MKLLFSKALVIDGTGREPFLGFVLVNEGRIISVGEGFPQIGGENVEREIKCEGRALLPGFINCHVHLALDASEHPMNNLASQNSYTALIQATVNAKKMLFAGFTTVRDCGGKEEEIIALKKAVDSCLVEGPRIISCGPALRITGGHFLGREVDNPFEVRKAARELISHGADFIKVMGTGGIGHPGEKFGAQEIFYDELCEAVQVARNAGKNVAVHSHVLAGVPDWIRAGATSIEHGTLMDAETAAVMAEKGIFLVPTFASYAIQVQKGEAGGIPSHMADSSRAIMKSKVPCYKYALNAGVKIAYGTDGGSPLNPHEDVVLEAREMVAAGTSNMIVIRSLTSSAAELLQLDSITGTISVGKIADLVLLAGNPLKDINALGQPVLVLKEGKVIRS
jgi:imidazolonepropionase-like amidohydrolase